MKQLTLFPELDLDSKEPIQIDHSTNTFFNKMVEKPVRKPNAVPPKTKTIKKPMSKGGSATPFQDALTNIQKPRKENMSERIERMVYQYDGGPKPKHYDNPNIVDDENYGKRPKQFNNNDPSTYPSDRDQRQKLSTWDLILETSKGDKEQMKEIRQTLNQEFKRNGKKFLSDKELKIIGKHPTQQIKLPEIKQSVLPFNPSELMPTPKVISPEERRFNEIMEESRKEKIRNATTGLAGLLGGMDIE